MSTELPARARVVVIGGGVIGCSVAYHLTRLGWTDVLVLRDSDGYVYFKEDAGKLLVGAFEPVAKPWPSAEGESIPEDFCFDELPTEPALPA